MPKTRSAKKNVRKTLTHTLRNRLRKERLKKVIRAFQAVLKSGDAAKAREALVKAQRALDKAASKGWLHKNAANRKKARMALAANKISGKK
jgi:small subunit ribosomal protein S20